MLHCLAYGNSDQASFRDLEVRDCFDIMSVPSTIASYYSDATAAFVLTSDLKYFIEPRTPLFQETLREPRASHYTLAAVMGPTVEAHLGTADDLTAGERHFSPEFYSQDVCDEVVSNIVRFQREYGGRARDVSAKLERYRSLLQRARGKAEDSQEMEVTRGPEYVLCPYFAADSLQSAWWKVTQRVWRAALQLNDPNSISPVVAISDVGSLAEALQMAPAGLSDTVFFWIPGFDERQVSISDLRSLKDGISQLGKSHGLINLYGGFFSILLGEVGLHGFNNGLGYSESRQWPTLDATGAAPARYYVERLHAYLPTAAATALVERDRSFECLCSVCDGGSRLPNELSYHELKRHFALARASEMRQVEEAGLSRVCETMREDQARARVASQRMPRNVRIPRGHLSRWADALDS